MSSILIAQKHGGAIAYRIIPIRKRRGPQGLHLAFRLLDLLGQSHHPHGLLRDLLVLLTGQVLRLGEGGDQRCANWR